MEFKVVKAKDLSGIETTVYTVIVEGERYSLFDQFLLENNTVHGAEVRNIISRLRLIGSRFSARADFFKLNEGKPGDGVCALYDEPEKSLRLYCIRYGNLAVILGGGGQKGKYITAWQENDKLSNEVNLMIRISKILTQAIKEKQIKFSADGKELLGDLNFQSDE